jgi:regulatory protein
LTIHPRGRGELTRALAERGFERGTVAQALAQLEEEGWLDDLGAARSAVRLRGERYGARRIERELKSRGFSRETVEAALSERDPRVEETALSRALERVWKRHAGLPTPARRRRAVDSLARRGFSPEKVSEMIDRLNHEIERGPRTLS